MNDPLSEMFSKGLINLKKDNDITNVASNPIHESQYNSEIETQSSNEKSTILERKLTTLENNFYSAHNITRSQLAGLQKLIEDSFET